MFSMHILIKPLMMSALLIASACASSGGRDSRQSHGPAAGLDQSQQLLARARSLQAEQGCAKAIPSYRVISSFGDGYDVAQYELGACLLDISGAGATETALFREEALFWLKRAAWAGNARAQGKLASILSGAPSQNVDGVSESLEEAMGWALVYQENSVRELYALPDVAAPVLNHLRTTLPPDAMHNAVAFADDFEKIAMTAFFPPARAQPKQAAQRERRRPEGGKQRRRR